MMIARECKHAEIDKAMQQLIEKQKLEKQVPVVMYNIIILTFL
jgi:hypothetical protein